MKTIFNTKIVVGFIVLLVLACEEKTPVPASESDGQNEIDPSSPGTYTNGVLDVSGDPFCIRFGDVYYLYLPIQNGDGTGGKVKVWTSANLVDWSGGDVVYDNTNHNYSGKYTTNLWAPEVMEHNGKYYLYVVNVMSDPVDAGVGDKDIVVIEGDSPTSFNGSKTILLDGLYAFIDPSPFSDPDNGNLYLVYKERRQTGTGSQINIQPMVSPTVFGGNSKMIFHSDDIPESANVLEHPHIRKDGGKFFLFFSKDSGKKPLYKIDYAVANDVMGAYTHKGTLFQSDSDLSGTLNDKVIAPGGSSIVVDGDNKSWMVYRQKTTTETTFEDRVVCIDRIDIFGEEGEVRGTPSKGIAKTAPLPL